jgi:hypothetical protein
MDTNKIQKIVFSLKLNMIHTTTEVTVLPSSFYYWNGNKFLAHFYCRKYEIKLGSGKESHPSRMLYIGPSKRLNDYYGSRV